jgi:hypothetical protein
VSWTEIYAFDKEGNAKLFGEIQNSWRGGIAIWAILEERYLPPYIPDYVKACNWYKPDMCYKEIISRNGFKPTRLSSMGNEKAINDIWDLAYDEKVADVDKTVLLTTFDNAVVRIENVPEIIKAFKQFDGETSLKEQSDILQEIVDSGEYIAVAWNQTSVSGDSWNFGYDEEKDESTPYNLNKGDKHWYIY